MRDALNGATGGPAGAGATAAPGKPGTVPGKPGTAGAPGTPSAGGAPGSPSSPGSVAAAKASNSLPGNSSGDGAGVLIILVVALFGAPLLGLLAWRRFGPPSRGGEQPQV